jgi:hypothetical protein
MGADAECFYQDRTERHHYHEIEDVAELDACKGEQ